MAGSKNEDIAAAVLAALSQHRKRTTARKPMKHFRDTDLHAYIMARLSDPAPSHDSLHPKLLIDVIDVAGISRDRGAKLDDAGWRGLAPLAANDKVSSLPGTNTARRYVWARITDWNAELVASVLVHFAYAGGFLRVTVRPAYMRLTPDGDTARAADSAGPGEEGGGADTGEEEGAVRLEGRGSPQLNEVERNKVVGQARSRWQLMRHAGSRAAGQAGAVT